MLLYLLFIHFSAAICNMLSCCYCCCSYNPWIRCFLHMKHYIKTQPVKYLGELNQIIRMGLSSWKDEVASEGITKNSECLYIQNYSLELTNFSIFTSGSSIYRFPFFFSRIFNTDNFSSGWLRVGGGKFPCGPSARSWRDKPAVDRTVSVYPPLLLERSLLLLLLLLLPHFLPFCTVTQTATFHCPRPEPSFHFSLSPSCSHTHTHN